MLWPRSGRTTHTGSLGLVVSSSPHDPRMTRLRQLRGSGGEARTHRRVGTGRRLLWCVALPATLATNPGAAQTARRDSTWRDHNAAARAAYERKDHAAYRAQLLQLEASLSGHSLVLYKLAAAEALLGNGDEAIRRLQVYAATGLTAQLSTDTDFASLHGRADFDSTVAVLARNARPVSTSALAFTLPDARLLPEDITYD